jgi:hypothetical protein
MLPDLSTDLFRPAAGPVPGELQEEGEAKADQGNQE